MSALISDVSEPIKLEPGSISQTTARRFSSKRAYIQAFAATLTTRCAGVLTGLLGARLLGPTARGELAVIVFLPILLIPLAEFELPRSIAYEVSKQKEVPAEVVATSFWLAIILGGFQSILLMLALPAFLTTGKLYLLPTARWFVLYLPAVYLTLFLTGIDQGRGRFGRFSIFQTLTGIFYLLSILVAWGIGAISAPAFALGMLLGAIVTGVIRTIMDWQIILNVRPRLSMAWGLLSRGFSYYLPAVAGFALIRTDMLLLVRLAGTEAIGLYAVAQAVAMGQIGAVNPFIQVVFTSVASESDQCRALQSLTRHFRIAQLAVIGTGLVTVGLTPWGIRFLFGAKFIAATTAACLLIGATAFWGMGQVLEQGLRAAGHPRPGIVSNLLGLGVLCGVGIPTFLRLGINGMAAALLAAELANLAALIAFSTFFLKIPLQSFWAFETETLRELTIYLRQVYCRVFPWSCK